VPSVKRRAVVAATPPIVWQTVADPHQLSRWWPRVQRVEGVDGRGFTEVLRSDKGATVRADFRIAVKHKPTAIAWAQDIDGTPFAKLLRSSETRVTLAAAGPDATTVEVRLDQKLHGVSRLGGFLVRRAARKQVDDALAALVDLYA
jgi:carbon monoxide dehydrogenase subunit G